MEIDSLYLKQLQHDNDYMRDINDQNQNQNIEVNINRPKIDISDDTAVTVGAILLGAVIVALLGYVLRRYVKVDYMEDKHKGMGEDTIYGHKWDEEVRRAISAGENGKIAVLCYLRWLDSLNDNGVIEFHQSKTPGMFLKEVKAYAGTHDVPGMVEKTETLTRQYLRVRYGHKHISADEARKLIEL